MVLILEKSMRTMDEFLELDAEETFHRLPYAKDDNDQLVPDEWMIHRFQMTYPIDKDRMKMEIDPDEYSYVFFKKTEQQEGGSRTCHQRRGEEEPEGEE
jgi:hypothetical protein